MGKPAAAICYALVACSTPATTLDAPSGPWSLLPVPVPTRRLEPGVTALGQQLVVVGGFDTSLTEGLDITKRVDLLDVSSDTWSTLPDAPVAWTHIQLAAIGTTLYLLGGLEGQTYTARGLAYALDTQSPPLTWRPLAPMPSGLERGSAAVVVVPPRIYLLGGAGTNNALATNLYYDIIADAWSGQCSVTKTKPCAVAADCAPSDGACLLPIPDLPAARSHPAGFRRSDSAVVVVGGLGTLTADSQNADVWALVPTTTQWQTQPAMPSARGGCAYGLLAGQLVCAGGEAGTSALSVVEVFDPNAQTWTTAAAMPMPRAGTQGAVIGQRFYVPGGAAQLQFVPTDTVYVYSPNDTAM